MEQVFQHERAGNKEKDGKLYESYPSYITFWCLWSPYVIRDHGLRYYTVVNIITNMKIFVDSIACQVLQLLYGIGVVDPICIVYST